MTLGDLAVVLVGAGSSQRMGFDKLWIDLGGRPLLAWSLEAAYQAQPSSLVVVTAPLHLDEASCLVQDGEPHRVDITSIVAGGERRRDSVAQGLAATRGERWIAVHDAARPFALPTLYAAGRTAAAATGAAVPGVPVKDTVKRVRQGNVVETPVRSSLVAVQTPQVFRRDFLEQALASTADDATDEAALLEQLGVPVAVFPGDEHNFKVTTPLDLLLARALVAEFSATPAP